MRIGDPVGLRRLTLLALGLAAWLWGGLAQAAVGFQPAFHQALRFSEYASGSVTYRLKLPVGRAGQRVRVTFMAGDGALAIKRATLARASGETAAGLVDLTFGGKGAAALAARELLTSDPVSFPVAFDEELFVSFEVSGSVAASSILAFPGSFARAGSFAGAGSFPASAAWNRAVGVATVEVEGPLGRAFVAIGDSITEGYIEGDASYVPGRPDDYRNGWTMVLQRQLGLPVANAGVSGQGLFDALKYLDREVKAVAGVTDCILLIGTNDLPSSAGPEKLQNDLTTMIGRLTGYCRVWVGTLLPKDRSSGGSLATVNAQKAAVNGWIRALTNVAGVVDFEAATRDPAQPDRFLTGYAIDGIHPSVAGHLALGSWAAAHFADPELTAVSPARDVESGGAQVTLTGRGFRSGLAVSFGAAPSTQVRVIDPKTALATAPPHPEGLVAVAVSYPDGTRHELPGAFEYFSTAPKIIACDPARVPATIGGSVRVDGARFGGAPRVLVNGAPVAQVTAVSETSLRLEIPAAPPGVARVAVATDGGTGEHADCFELRGPPVLTEVSPKSLVAGTAQTVRLSGERFDTGARVQVDGADVPATVVDERAIDAQLPALPLGQKTLSITNPDGQSAKLEKALSVEERRRTPEPLLPATPGEEEPSPPRPKGCSVAGGEVPLSLLLLGRGAWRARRRRGRSARGS